MGLARLAALHGVATSYQPSAHRTLQVPDETVVAVLAALGVDARTPEAVRTALEAHEAAAARRLLPATLVSWTGPAGPQPPPAVAALPAGTRLRVETEQGPAVEWQTPAADPPEPAPDAARPPSAAAASGASEGRVSGNGSESGNSNTSGNGRVAGHGSVGSEGWGQLPLGVHRLGVRTPEGQEDAATLVVAPARVPQPPGRTYGFMVQLYSLLSRRSWGMGDLGDLAELAAWSGRSLGAGFVQINPLHAAVPGTPTDPSPYRPSSRRFPDPVHLRVEDVPEYAHVPPADRARIDDLLDRAATLRDGVLNKGELIDRDAVWQLKKQALELVRPVPLGTGRRAAYCDFLAEQGTALEDHATWCALAEMYGPDWHTWPSALRDAPHSAAVERARNELHDRVDLHCWLAWLTDCQLAAAQSAARAAGMPVGIVHDLAVGVHPGGADAWAQQDAYARGMSVGAPPDAFNALGQDWGLPPWRPDVLAAAGYAPFRGLLRGLLRNAGALRIDHVMGLFRLWWVPEGLEPTAGTYVRYDAEAMLAVLALEAHLAGASVIGEDLGTVEPGVRDALTERGVSGTSVMWFERDWAGTGRPLPPENWREHCLATATTHDLPSTAARLTGEHVALRHRLGLFTRPLEEERAEAAVEVADWLSYLARLGLLPEGVGDEEGEIRAVYRFLLRTPARMVGIWLPDAVGDRRPQNLPGTWDQYPNWRLPVADAEGRPVTLEGLAASPRLHDLIAAFRTRTASAGAVSPPVPPAVPPPSPPPMAPPGARLP
ncbi:4-alpha-glucanotransferase [Streptomyces sp. ISL-99]|uniref:4-alpha-glucanotransferase n=1 Tax=Streptomyces sp. ISL-99 TaxID=2819193 RepID=UPI001BE71143|nr:4-alpha-glucanotransferase [Streptomyces sp. ISL-99]MBT2527173.1 4-alpha-glucanotransferase [Streptomyces sp. ISL-99]